MASMVIASQLGLEIGVRGQAFLVPYGKVCQLVPGWMGLVSLLNNTGRATAWTGSVFEGDDFEFTLGSNPHIHHRPGPNYGMPDKLEWAYACGKVNGSEQPVIECWPIKMILGRRDKFNKVGAKHYSFTHPEMYARKVVLLQVLKYMPCSVELTSAVEAEGIRENGGTPIIDGGIVIEQQPDPLSAEVLFNKKDAGDNLNMEPSKLAGATNATVTVPPPAKAEGATVNYVKGVRDLLKLAVIVESIFLDFAKATYQWDETITSIDEASFICPVKLQAVFDDWQNVEKAYRKAAKR